MDPTAVGRRHTLDQRILQTLMIPFQMVMCAELRYRSSKMSFAERDYPVETFFLDGSHIPLRVRIRIGSLIRRLHHANPSLLEPLPHCCAPLRIPIADQHAT